MEKYAPIGFKSDYNLLTSTLKIKDIIEYALLNGCKYIGVLEDNPYSLMDFFDKCEKNNIKPVFGINFSFYQMNIYLYITNLDGYKNVIKLFEKSQSKDLVIDDLVSYSKGLLCVLPFESYKCFNKIKNLIPTFLAYKTEKEKIIAEKITSNSLLLNRVLMLNEKDEIILKILNKIAGKEYIKTDASLLSATPEEIDKIDKFVEKINLEFNYKNRYIPKYCETATESLLLLKNLSIKGLNKRLGNNVSNSYKERLLFELETIEKMGFVDYFLIVYDYVKFAKKNNIYVGPGRGSAAGSLVSYSLGITDIDPIKYNLLFERFLNPERITMPDIDIDFEDIKRGEIIEYVRKKYGTDKVALIVAYGTFGAKQAIRDVCKCCDVNQNIIDALANKLDGKKSLKENIQNSSLVDFIKSNKLENLFKMAMKIEGLKRHTTIHAAGVVISSIPLIDIVPTYHTQDGILTGYTMEYLEKLGLLKMDFLALRNLTTIHNMINIINQKVKFDLKSIPLNDSNTFKLFQDGKTDDIFQFESQGMKNFLRKLKPTTFSDLVAANALFRPGPMDNIDEFCARRNGQKQIEYLHHDLEPILKETYGIIVYQEQIMQILVKMAGYTFAEADLVRRAMSKKKYDVMVKEKDKFIKKAISVGYDEYLAASVYEMIVKFANYGFNKSHSVSYALIGYYMAYMKVHFFEAYHVNALNMNNGSETKIKDTISNARAKGFKIISPSISLSYNEFVNNGNEIILPLSAIKNVSQTASDSIIKNRPYKDFFEFVKKNYGKNVNRTTIEYLIKADALRDFSYNKATLLKNIDSALTYLELCETLDESLIMKPEIEIYEEDEQYSDLDLFGFYVNGHPASKINDLNIIKLSSDKISLNKKICVYVLIEKIKTITTKKGEKMAFLEVSDDTGSTSAVIFPRQANLIANLKEQDLVKLSCEVSSRNGETQLIIDKIL